MSSTLGIRGNVPLDKFIRKVLSRLKLRLLPYLMDIDFKPYIKPLDIVGIEAKFFFGTDQARDWYDPIKRDERTCICF